MADDRLTTLDTSFLWFEHPGRPIHVGGVAIFEAGPLVGSRGRLRIGAIRRHLYSRVDELPRLRQRIEPNPLGLDRPRWVDDDDFDIDHHLDVVKAPAPGDDAALRRVAEEIHGKELDPAHSPWHLCIVTGLSDGRLALIERAHHALVDGVGGIDLAAVFLDLDRVGTRSRPVTRPAPMRPADGPSSDSGRPAGPGVAWAVGDAIGAGAQAGAEVARVAVSALTHPGGAARTAAGLARGVATMVANGVTAPPTPLNTAPGRRRQLAWVRTELADLKATGHAAGGTVNDVVLAAVTAGLRDLLIERRVPLPHHLALKALVPISERELEDVPGFGNRVTAMLAPLPVGLADPGERLDTVVATMRGLKASGEAQAMAAFLQAADLVPPPVARAMVWGLDRQPFVNLVVTNVPGPPIPLYMLGAQMLEAFPVVPLGANLSVGVAILSYNRALNLGLTADPDTCPDLDVLARGIERGFEEIR